ncbi:MULTISPECIES: DUF7144 family membrane protein [unclassified Streptomyces]|uniref:DUF7144 family membrane protein n=1 Tax=unclassified Streptomyces TaxID=2593676 RepID=UPI002E2AB1A1|nr:hypothetical protein [Streptomyces sp. NBC_01429]
MSTSGTGTGYGAGTGAHAERKAAWAVGGSILAGVLLLVTGATNILQSITAIRRDSFLNGVSGYAYRFNLTSWGWIHFAIGVLLVVTGIALLATRHKWARYLGITFAALNLVAQFMYLPYQPVWAVVGMALSAYLIWALATERGGLGSGART